ncbi:MAG: hypothetical protein H6767_03030 [Candidatus Peribacteria bacterium]|nr:MAG: hypothetical protein H6767_03030 [Candidatus Peribacteria bacterium]
MLSDQAVKTFRDKGYTYEEIERIKKSLQDIEDGNTIPFEDVIQEFCGDQKGGICIK